MILLIKFLKSLPPRISNDCIFVKKKDLFILFKIMCLITKTKMTSKSLTMKKIVYKILLPVNNHS